MSRLQYETQICRWDVLEAVLQGPSDGNPFTEQNVRAIFTGAHETVTVDGFYDGEGLYRVRFMPSFEGEYALCVTASFLQRALTGCFFVAAAKPDNHGPVRVAAQYHFAYEDGTPYYSLGTTCYAWALQDDACIENTLKLMEQARFNKLRFCLFPKHYAYNFAEPRSYPYEGTPMDSSVLTLDNFNQYDEHAAGNDWDFERFQPAHFRHLEQCVQALAQRGIEADLIVMHPYDRWGFSNMSAAQDDLYWRYVLARFAAYRNVWWSLANEYDLMRNKTIADWERYASIICEKDPYRHLRSIHNCHGFYDYNRPWITHCSIQRQECYMSAEYVDKWCDTYKKPVVMDEMSYEGTVQFGWGNITGEEMLRRFWETACRGGYPGHGETYHCESGPVWWSHGGALHGESWKRIGFLHDIMASVPGHGLVAHPMKWDFVCAAPAAEFTRAIKSWYLLYFSFMQPALRELYFDDTTRFSVEIIDTWNMTIEPQGTVQGKFTVHLPGRPFQAVRLRALGQYSNST